MSLYRRGRIWWCRWRIKGRKIPAESTGTADREKAQEYHDRRSAAIWDEIKLGKRPSHTWDEAALSWWTDRGSKKRSAEDDRLRLKVLTANLTGRQLDRIDAAAIDKAIPTLSSPKLKGKQRPLTEATRNRYRALASAILHHAAGKGWIAKAPAFTYIDEGDGRFEFLTKPEARALLEILPENLAAMARFDLATGLRRHNCTHLQWSQIDLERRCAWVWPDQTKSGKPLAVPLNSDAMAVLRAQKGKHLSWVFPYRGKPVTDANTKAWKKAAAAIGRPEFDFHGLRHTWASWHVMAGTPLEVLQKLGGWHSIDMVLRYAHLAPGYVAPYADRIVLDEPEATILDTDFTPVSDYSQQEQGMVGWTMGLEPTTTGITILSDKKKAA